MQLKETDNCWPVDVEHGEFPAILRLMWEGRGISFDQDMAQEFLPILEHFIKTGEIPDAS